MGVWLAKPPSDKPALPFSSSTLVIKYFILGYMLHWLLALPVTFFTLIHVRVYSCLSSVLKFCHFIQKYLTVSVFTICQTINVFHVWKLVCWWYYVINMKTLNPSFYDTATVLPQCNTILEVDHLSWFNVIKLIRAQHENLGF